MAREMRWNLVPLALAVIVFAVLAWAWTDGGREPVRTITVPVAIPGDAR